MSWNKRKPNSELIWLFALAIVWILLVVQVISQNRYLYAASITFAFIAIIIKRVVGLIGFHFPVWIKWVYMLVGLVLLVLQIGYQDVYLSMPFMNVLFILLGCWGIWSIDRKK